LTVPQWRFYSTAKKDWVTEPGEFEILLDRRHGLEDERLVRFEAVSNFQRSK